MNYSEAVLENKAKPKFDLGNQILISYVNYLLCILSMITSTYLMKLGAIFTIKGHNQKCKSTFQNRVGSCLGICRGFLLGLLILSVNCYLK